MKGINLLIPGDFPPTVSGIATYFHEIWRKLPHDNRIIVAPKEKSSCVIDRKYPHRILRVKVPSGNSLFHKIIKGLIYLYWALKLHLKYGLKILHSGQILSSGLAGWILKKFFNVPYVIYIYGSETVRFGSVPILKTLLKISANASNYLIANSNFTKDEYIQFGIPPEKIRVITPCVDIHKFQPAGKDKRLIEKYKLRGKFVLLTVARLDERKGHDKVIEALAKLKNKYKNLVYIIVGTGREKERLEALTKTAGLQHRIIFTGFVPDRELPNYYNLCDIFILLNRQTEIDKNLKGDYEGFGIVFIEAGACGKPVIAGNFGGVFDAVKDRYSGLIINPLNIDEITGAIELLIKDEKLRAKLSHHGIKWVKDHFTPEKKAEQILHIEKEILDD